MEVERWLTALDMPQYANTMVSFGFTDLASLQSLQRLDLEGMGIPEEHINAILAAVVDMKSEPPPLPGATSAPVLSSMNYDSDDDSAGKSQGSGSSSGSKICTSHALPGSLRLLTNHRIAPLCMRVARVASSKSSDVSDNVLDRKRKTSTSSRHKHKPSIGSASDIDSELEDEKFIHLLGALDETYRMSDRNALSRSLSDNRFSLTACVVAEKIHLRQMPSTWRKSISFAASTSINYSHIQQEKVLSKSLFGEVTKGKLGDTQVVVRVLNHKRAQIREFCKESLVLSQLKHPNVVNTLGACLSKDKPLCIVLEYLGGGSLYDYLRRNPDLTLEQRLRLAIAITSGLDYLHTRIPVIIHRDLTSRNILVCACSLALGLSLERAH